MNRAPRRTAVAGLYLGYLVSGVLWCHSAGQPEGIEWGMFALAGVVSLGSLIALWRAAGGVILSTAHLLDERQRSVRDRAFRISYFVISLVFLAVIATVSWLSSRSPADLTARHFLVPLGFGAVLVTMTLPLAMVAWTEPDPPEDSGTFTKTVK